MNHAETVQAFERLEAELTAALEGKPLKGRVVVIGSGSMWLHGIDRPMSYDIDLFVAPELYDVLKLHGWEELLPDPDQPYMLEWRALPVPVHAWEESYTPQYGIGGTDGREVRDDTLRLAVMVGAWPCQDLGQLREWKQEAGRPKDLRDVKLIDSFFRPGVRRIFSR